jgi:hypothetical protein
MLRGNKDGGPVELYVLQGLEPNDESVLGHLRATEEYLTKSLTGV